MTDRNKEVAAVLKANWGWLDPDNSDDVGKFLVEVERYEMAASGAKMALSPDFYMPGMAPEAKTTFVHDQVEEGERYPLSGHPFDLAG